jgi:hypothetical protein
MFRMAVEKARADNGITNVQSTNAPASQMEESPEDLVVSALVWMYC